MRCRGTTCREDLTEDTKEKAQGKRTALRQWPRKVLQQAGGCRGMLGRQTQRQQYPRENSTGICSKYGW